MGCGPGTGLGSLTRGPGGLRAGERTACVSVEDAEHRAEWQAGPRIWHSGRREAGERETAQTDIVCKAVRPGSQRSVFSGKQGRLVTGRKCLIRGPSWPSD